MSTVKTTLTRGGFIDLKQGNFVSYGGRVCRIRRVLSIESVVVQYLDTDETERLHPTVLRHVEDAEQSSKVTEKDASPQEGAEATDKDGKPTCQDHAEISDKDWEQAKERYETIKPLLANPNRTRADVEGVARKQGVNTSTIYVWMSDYMKTGQISGLVKQKRGRKRGTKLLSAEQEAVIEELLESDFLDDQQLTPAAVIEEIDRRCEEKDIEPPHPNTVRNRIADIPLKRRLRERGLSEEAEQKTEARPGEFPHGTFPLECVQIDHVRLDIKAVDAETRKPIERRPWLTLAIDAYSRMIVGFFLSFASPSSFGAGVCLYMAMMRKDDVLSVHGLPGRWPVFGKMRKVLADNAKEFKGALLQRACEDNGIDITLRPKKTPRYGAYIEAMVGNVNRQLHKRRGTTHRSPKVSPDYDSSQKAVYTLADIEAEVVDWIVNCYHVNKHSSLNTTPLAKWEKGLLGDSKTPGTGLPQIPANPEKLRLDFMPYERRVVNPQGIEIANRTYYHETLRTWVGSVNPEEPSERRKFIIRYDPRTIRHVWFWDPEVKNYFQIPLRDTTWPDISWSEFDEYLRLMRKEGAEFIDEAAIKGYILRARARESNAIELTEAARKGAKGKVKSAPASVTTKPSNTAPGSNAYAKTPDVPAKQDGDTEMDPFGDIFDTPVSPFQDIDI